jgi:hypothetical protein
MQIFIEKLMLNNCEEEVKSYTDLAILSGENRNMSNLLIL